jgi:hypothetical protein
MFKQILFQFFFLNIFPKKPAGFTFGGLIIGGLKIGMGCTIGFA